jgi:hypothetical protein
MFIVMRTKLIDVAARLGDHVVALSLALLVLLPALVTVTDSGHRSTAVLPPLATASTTLDTAAADSSAEGTDVLPVSFHDAPYELWNGLRQVMPGAYDDDVPGIGTFYVPVGSTVAVPGGLYLATLDGWAECHDTWFAQECSATGPVQMLNIPVRTADSVYRDDPAALDADRALAGLGVMTDGATTAQVVHVAQVTTTAPHAAAWSGTCVKAARAILRALKAGKRIEEDLSYRGMTRVADRCNDRLAVAFYADGHDLTTIRDHHKRLRVFLKDVASGKAQKPDTGDVRS